MPAHRLRSAARLFLLAGTSVAAAVVCQTAAADQTVTASPTTEITIRLGDRCATFRTAGAVGAGLDGLSVAAERDDRMLENPDGSSMGWTPGYRLTSRVIVRALDPKTVAGATAGQAVKVTPAVEDGRPGPLNEFFYVDAASVRSAISLAEALAAHPDILEASLDIERPRTLRSNIPTDPQLAQQWHLMNALNPAADTNADAAWKAGFTGAGVTVGVLEGGWEIGHPDLSANYHAAASQPDAGSSCHGTSTAGLVGAAANNGLGGVGVSWGGKISRLYYGTDTDIQAAFSFRNDLNQVKTNAWGPFDNGFIATVPSTVLAGIADAAMNGRGGKGTVIVWSAGNGRQNNNDRVDYDSYTSNRFAIAVGAVDSTDRASLYSEPGSSLMLVTTSDYDLSSTADRNIYTTACGGGYEPNFGGTSSASPIAAGVIALVLQANPNLTWRDVQHVLIRSARRVNPSDPSWGFNGSGGGTLRAWSEQFGFGAIDAGAAVALAQGWVNRPAETSFTGPVVNVNAAIPDNNSAGITSNQSVTGTMIVERVQVTVNIPHTRIGQLRITLTSPSGTVATLATLRSDNTVNGYSNFTFTPVRFWEERSAGTWTLKVADEVASPAATGTLTNWQLRLYGYEQACRCDWNLSGATGLQDLFDYIGSYFLNRGDFNGDGATSVQDLFDYLACYFSGC